MNTQGVGALRVGSAAHLHTGSIGHPRPPEPPTPLLLEIALWLWALASSGAPVACVRPRRSVRLGPLASHTQRFRQSASSSVRDACTQVLAFHRCRHVRHRWYFLRPRFRTNADHVLPLRGLLSGHSTQDPQITESRAIAHSGGRCSRSAGRPWGRNRRDGNRDSIRAYHRHMNPRVSPFSHRCRLQLHTPHISGLGVSHAYAAQAGRSVFAAAASSQRQPCAAQALGSAPPREAGSCRRRRHAALEATAREGDAAAGPA